MDSRNMTLEDRRALTRHIAKVMSEILSDQYAAKITIVLKEDGDNVPDMSADTMQSTVS